MYRKFKITVALILFVFLQSVSGQYIPPDMPVPVCSGQTITTGAPGNSGYYSIGLPCWYQSFSPYLDFYRVVIQSGTTFAFTIAPVQQVDYDFGAWKNPNWDNLQNTPTADIRGSQNDPFASGQFSMGLSLTATDLCEEGGSAGYPEPGFVRYFDVEPGDEILIVIDRWDTSATLGYTLSFGGDAELDCTILGNHYGKCDVDYNDTEQFAEADLLPDLEEDFPGHSFLFYETEAAAQSGTGPQVSFPITVPYNNGDPTELFVRVMTPSGTLARVVKLFLFVNKLPVLLADEVELPLLCRETEDGQATFNLLQAQTLLVENPLGLNFKFYTTLADAIAGGENFIDPANAYLSGNATVYARIETGPLDGNEEGCFETAAVHLKVSDFDVQAVQLEYPDLCDQTGDGTVIVDLTENEGELTGNPTNYQITYHTSQTDAESGDNPIPNPEAYPLPMGQTTIYVRIHSLTDPCHTVSTIVYNIVERPVVTQPAEVTVCADSDLTNYEFDLTVFDSQVVADPENYTITYHLTWDDANNGQNAIQPAEAFLIAVNSTITVYIRVEALGCYDITEADISVYSKPGITTPLEIGPVCDEDGSGFIVINLYEAAAEMVSVPADYQISFHTSFQEADLGENPITDPGNFLINAGETVTLYIRVKNLNNPCYSIGEITIITAEKPVLNTPEDVLLCDVNFDGVYLYDLNLLAPMLNGEPSMNYDFYLSLQDALSGTNGIPQNQWSAYPITTLPFDIWAVGISGESCLSDPMQIHFAAGTDVPLLTETAGPVEYCEGDTVDLSLYEEVFIAETGVFFSYYASLSDAQNSLNPIVNTDAYAPNGDDSVYVRLEREGNCPVIVEIQFKQLHTPSIELNSQSYELCPGDSFDAEAESDDPQAEFFWYLNGEEVGTGPIFTITEPGNYTVVVIGGDGCENEADIVVSSPATPSITGIEVGPDYFIVSAVSGGGGVLEYSIDLIFWQNSPRFDHLNPGETYTVYVRENGCMMDSYDVSILGITNFVSPNADGKNDTWEVRGIEVTPQATIKIFDRFGKMFVDTTFEGGFIWDGKYMGRPVASGDYWYILDVPSDGIIVEKKFIGHISVRNQ